VLDPEGIEHLVHPRTFSCFVDGERYGIVMASVAVMSKHEMLVLTRENFRAVAEELLLYGQLSPALLDAARMYPV
jgi:hypothetical protein